MRHITDAALELIKRNEGMRLSAYRDVAGIPTIGYGHTPARMGTTITEAQATELLRQDLAKFEIAVDDATHMVPTTDEEFSAMVCLTFNIGPDAFRKSSVLRKHLAGDKAGASAAFMMWDKAHVDGQLVVIPGLLRRRNEERLMYLSGTQKFSHVKETPAPQEPPQAPPAPTPAPAPSAPSTGLLSRLRGLFS